MFDPDISMYNPQGGVNITSGPYFKKFQKRNMLGRKKYQIMLNNLGNEVFNIYTIKPLALYDYHNFNEQDDFMQNSDNNYLLLPANIIGNHDGAKNACREIYKRFIQNAKLRLTVASLGTQATLDYISPIDYAKELCDDVKKFVYGISERSISIGVRGEYTGDVLKALGIHNVDVIGCPSWFVNGKYQSDVIKKDWSYDLKVSCFTSRGAILGKQYFIKEALKYKDPRFVMQSEYEIIPYYFMLHNVFTFLRRYSYNLDYFSAVKILKNEYGISFKDQIFNPTIRKFFEFFLNVDEWSNFAKTRDLAFGTRIHGAIVHLKQGVPALLFAHDMRIMEIAEYLKIPYVRLDKIDVSKLNIRDIYEKTDFSAMNKAYFNLLKNYQSFVHKNGINFIEE